MNGRVLLASVAALFLATGAAHALSIPDASTGHWLIPDELPFTHIDLACTNSKGKHIYLYINFEKEIVEKTDDPVDGELAIHPLTKAAIVSPEAMMLIFGSSDEYIVNISRKGIDFSGRKGPGKYTLSYECIRTHLP